MQVKDPEAPALTRFRVYCCDKHDHKHEEDMVSVFSQVTLLREVRAGTLGRNLEAGVVWPELTFIDSFWISRQAF